MRETIITLYNLELCRLFVSLVISAAILFGLVLGYWIGKHCVGRYKLLFDGRLKERFETLKRERAKLLAEKERNRSPWDDIHRIRNKIKEEIERYERLQLHSSDGMDDDRPGAERQ